MHLAAALDFVRNRAFSNDIWKLQALSNKRVARNSSCEHLLVLFGEQKGVSLSIFRFCEKQGGAQFITNILHLRFQTLPLFLFLRN